MEPVKAIGIPSLCDIVPFQCNPSLLGRYKVSTDAGDQRDFHTRSHELCLSLLPRPPRPVSSSQAGREPQQELVGDCQSESGISMYFVHNKFSFVSGCMGCLQSDASVNHNHYTCYISIGFQFDACKHVIFVHLL